MVNGSQMMVRYDGEIMVDGGCTGPFHPGHEAKDSCLVSIMHDPPRCNC